MAGAVKLSSSVLFNECFFFFLCAHFLTTFFFSYYYCFLFEPPDLKLEKMEAKNHS